MPEIQINAHDGGTFKAYVTLPEGNGPAPAVIMIQEIFGINQEMRDKCDAMAAKGYVAICPDLFWRIEPDIELVDSVPEQLERAFELFGLYDVELGMKDLASTLKAARAHERGNGKVGCVGYCLGGKLAYLMATDTDVDASVSYYGVGIEGMLDKAKNISHPLLMHIAEEDQFVDKEAQELILSGLADNPHVTLHTYPDADHAFARGNGMHYDEASAVAANTRTDDFLENALK